MSKFKTQYDEHDRVYQDSGSRVKVLHGPKFTERGVLEIIETGVEDLYDYIQSHAESVDIHVVLSRFAAGDVDALARTQGFYMDATDLPKTYAEILNSVLAGEAAFNQLPAEIKQKFNNSFSEWMSQMDESSWIEKMGLSREPVSEPAVVGATPGQVQDFTKSAVQPSVTPAQVQDVPKA